MGVAEIQQDGIIILHVEGSLDADGTQALEDKVVELLENGANNLVFDFTDLDYINSSGLRVLVLAYQRLKKSSGRVAICGVKDYIQEVFEVSGYDRIFSMYPSRNAALTD